MALLLTSSFFSPHSFRLDGDSFADMISDFTLTNTPKTDCRHSSIWADIISVFSLMLFVECKSIKINWCKCETNRKLLLRYLKTQYVTFCKVSLNFIENYYYILKAIHTQTFSLQCKERGEIVHQNCLKKCWRSIIDIVLFLNAIESGIAQRTETKQNKTKIQEYSPSFFGFT